MKKIYNIFRPFPKMNTGVTIIFIVFFFFVGVLIFKAATAPDCRYQIGDRVRFVDGPDDLFVSVVNTKKSLSKCYNSVFWLSKDNNIEEKQVVESFLRD